MTITVLVLSAPQIVELKGLQQVAVVVKVVSDSWAGNRIRPMYLKDQVPNEGVEVTAKVLGSGRDPVLVMQ